MNHALYTSFLGMRARQRTLDAISDNIANSSTTGFKSDQPFFRSFEAADVKGSAPNDRHGMGVLTGGRTSFATGTIRDTGRPLDVAIDGDAFFSVRTPRGERYTRAGSFTIDSTGQLVTQTGDLVLGENGAINLPKGEVTIGRDGSVMVGDRKIDRLKLVSFADPHAALAKEGANYFAATGSEKPATSNSANVMQGALEGSNVNTVTEMVAMMANGREFDSLEKTLSVTMNEIGRKVASDIGKI